MKKEKPYGTNGTTGSPRRIAKETLRLCLRGELPLSGRRDGGPEEHRRGPGRGARHPGRRAPEAVDRPGDEAPAGGTGGRVRLARCSPQARGGAAAPRERETGSHPGGRVYGLHRADQPRQRCLAQGQGERRFRFVLPHFAGACGLQPEICGLLRCSQGSLRRPAERV